MISSLLDCRSYIHWLGSIAQSTEDNGNTDGIDAYGFPTSVIFSPDLAATRTVPVTLLVKVYLEGFPFTLTTPPGVRCCKRTARTVSSDSNRFTTSQSVSATTSSPVYGKFSDYIIRVVNKRTSIFAFSSSFDVLVVYGFGSLLHDTPTTLGSKIAIPASSNLFSLN